MNGQVIVAMAVHDPDPVFFKKQLVSLNRQTYPNIRFLFLDDASSDPAFVCRTIEETLTRFEFRLLVQTPNVGTNRTYERLTDLCDGEYIAYCDQDDVWREDRIAKGVAKLEQCGCVMAYSDLSVIDGKGALLYDSFTQCRKRVVHRQGRNLWRTLPERCSVTGCTILVRTEIAQRAVPFPDNRYAWDHWLSIIAALNGAIAFIPEQLIKYRLHGHNQIGVRKLEGIRDKTDYIEKHLSRKADLYGLLIPKAGAGPIRTRWRKERERVLARMAFLRNPSWSKSGVLLRLLFKDVLLCLFETALLCDMWTSGSRVIEIAKRTKY